VRVLGIASSSRMLLSEEGIDLSSWRDDFSQCAASTAARALPSTPQISIIMPVSGVVRQMLYPSRLVNMASMPVGTARIRRLAGEVVARHQRSRQCAGIRSRWISVTSLATCRPASSPTPSSSTQQPQTCRLRTIWRSAP